MLKKKTYERIIEEMERVVPFSKLKMVYGKAFVESLKKQIIRYCIYIITRKKTSKLLSFYEFNELSDITFLYMNDVSVEATNCKDGIHFSIRFYSPTLDFLYQKNLENIEKNKKKRVQYKYAARQNRKK